MDKSVDEQIKQLSNQLSPKTAHQYKTYNTQYIQWCKVNKLLPNDQLNNESISYKALPLSSTLIHWFLLDTVITNANDTHKKINVIQSYIGSFQFLSKVCEIYGNSIVSIDMNYLDQVKDLHQYWHQLAELYSKHNNTIFPSHFIVSFNIWNPDTTHLKKTHFKTSLEKLRFLVDFHFTTYLKLTYNERSEIKLHSLKCNDISKTILTHNNSKHLLPQNSPFTCPFTSLAAYLFFRFYGISNISRGDGFPNLFNSTTVSSLALIKGRLGTEYPKDTTLNFSYTSIFKYCNLPYKRRQYFENTLPKDSINVNFPDINNEFFDNFSETFPNASQNPTQSSFMNEIPFDFTAILNMQSPYKDYSSFSTNDFFKQRGQLKPPQSIVLQFFPEIEYYKQKKNYTKLDDEAKDLLKLLESIRLIFVANLPIIYKFYPNHDIFKNEIFENTDILSFLNDSVFETNNITSQILPFKNFQNLSNEDLYNQLIELPSSKIVPNGSNITGDLQTNEGGELMSNAINEDMLNEFRKQNFQFIQFQTLSNFKTLITFLTKIFNNLSIKRSSKEAIAKQLNLFNDSILERINNSTPKDIKDYFLKKEIIKHKQDQLIQYKEDNDDQDDDMSDNNTRRKSQFKLMAIDDSSDDNDQQSSSESGSDGDLNDEIDSGDEGDNETMQEELKIMVDRFVTTKIDSIISQHLDNFEHKLDYMVESLVNEKIDAKLQKIDFSKYSLKRQRSYSNSSNESLEESNKKIPKTDPSNNNFKKIIQDSKFTIKPVNNSLSSPFAINNNANFSTPKVRKYENIETKTFASDTNKNAADSDNDLYEEKPSAEFNIDESIDTIEGIILEWFTPNPEMGNECVHSMNKTHEKSWRSGFESLYKQRKQIVEFYVYLINTEKLDRYKSIEICNNIKEKNSSSIKEFSKFLKTWKKKHDNSFNGLVDLEENM